MTTHPNHVHPRHKRVAPPAPYRALFKPIVPVTATKARHWSTYRYAKRTWGKNANAKHWKDVRKHMGVTRREMDRIRRKQAA